ncbi:MAG: FUSC family protein [Hyphomicrobiales bacterium]|nr:FUSC family protein [Hyphomicrobiales bacterium]
MAIACALSYGAITAILAPFVREGDTMKGGMWAVVATVFVFQETREKALTAGMGRLIATCVSFALCLAYLLIFPFTGLGMTVVIGLGTFVLIAIGRKEDIVTAGITTTVVMVVAGMNPDDAWPQPILRLFDSLVGIAVGVACKWFFSYLFFRAMREPVR